MVTVALDRLWLNLASDTSQSWSFQFITGISSQPVLGATSSVYAGGNYRQKTVKGRQSQLPVTLQACTAADRQVLEFELPQQILCIRDNTGRKFYGYYANPQITEHSYNDECDISMTFLEVTFTEAV